MKKGIKFGIYVPEELAKELEKCMESIGIKSKSKLVREALRLFITEHKWRTVGRATGVIGVIYSHGVSGIDEKLTDIQHGFLDIIVATLHVHLDRERCMLAIIVRGSSDRIKELLNKILALKGVITARPLLLEAF